MKIQIRSGVFETNSSSIHSIAVKRNSSEIGIHAWKARSNTQFLAFRLGQFAGSVKKYTSVSDRASYLWTLACSDDKKSADKRGRFISKTLEKIGIIAGFQEVRKKVYGDGDETWECCEAVDGTWFFIDHSDSWDTELVKKIFSDEEFMLDYLFGDSRVITYSDNGDFGEWLWSINDGIEREEYNKYN